MSWCRTLAAAGVLSALAASGALAQPLDDPSGDQTDRARALFERGVQALDEQRFADAAELLEQSLALREAPTARYNRALALRGAGRYREAIEDAERYLETASGPRHERVRPAVRTLLEELRAALGHLVLHVRGGAEEVEVDGEPIGDADGTYERPVDPGETLVRVAREGFAPVLRSAEVRAGARAELRLDASAEPLPATLAVVVRPSEARILWNGDELGRGRAELEVPLPREGRELELEVRAEGFSEERRRIHLAPGETAQLSFSLAELLPDPLRRKWWLWTLVAVGAAGLAAGFVVLLRPEESFQERFDVDQAVDYLRSAP